MSQDRFDRMNVPSKLYPITRIEDIPLHRTPTIPAEAYSAYEALVDHALLSAGMRYDYGHTCQREECCLAGRTDAKPSAPRQRVSSRRRDARLRYLNKAEYTREWNTRRRKAARKAAIQRRAEGA